MFFLCGILTFNLVIYLSTVGRNFWKQETKVILKWHTKEMDALMTLLFRMLMHYRISLRSSCIKLKGNTTGGGIGGKGIQGRGVSAAESFSC